MATATRWTVADAERLPPHDDGNRYEIIDGYLHVTTVPHVWHQVVTTEVISELNAWSSQTGAGLTIMAPGVIFSSVDAVAPDVVWISHERLAAIPHEDGKLHGPPELVVEVLSEGPANEERDRVTKLERYGYWGIQEYWIVDRFARRVEVYRQAEGALQQAAILGVDDELTSPLLPGFACQVGSLFAGIP